MRGGFFFKELTPWFVINGTSGTFLKSRADVQEAQLKEGMKPDDERYGIESEYEYEMLNYVQDGTTIRQRVPTLKGDYMDYYDGIYQSIVEAEAVPVSATEGISVMKIIEAAFQSHEQKRVIEVF